jgi:predicted dehydrogenase
MKTSNEPIRWGVAATGSIANSFAADFANLPRGDGGEIVAVGSRSQAAADSFAARHGVARAHGSYDDLAADPDIDVIYVAGLHPVHAPQAVQFIEAGKHVLVEKPLAMNGAEVDRMTAAARANNRFLMEAMWMRFNPTHVEVMRRLAHGAIGEIRRVVADFSLALPFDPDHRLYDLQKGGGALLDLAIYPLNLAWWALGPPDEIDHAGHVSATGVDDEVTLLCRWASGASAALTSGLRLSGPMTARIEGTVGVVEFPCPAHACASAVMRRGIESEVISGDTPGLRHQVVEVHRCIRAGELESPRMPWATSRALIGRFDAIRASLGVRYPADG